MRESKEFMEGTVSDESLEMVCGGLSKGAPRNVNTTNNYGSSRSSRGSSRNMRSMGYGMSSSSYYASRGSARGRCAGGNCG